MKNFVRWLKRVSHWVRDSSLFWWAVSGVAAAFLWVFACGWTEDAFQKAGLLLQLGGVLTVVGGISNTWAVFKDWVKQFPSYVPRTNTASINGTFQPFTGEMHMRSPAPVTVDGRLGHLEELVKSLTAEQGKTYAAVLQAETKAQQALDAKASQLSGQIAELKKSATRGFHFSAMGAFWVFFGTVSSGFARCLHLWMTP